MNAKIIAALAVLALAFVGLAFADDQADATDPALMPAQTEYFVSNLTADETITIGVLEAPTADLTVTAVSAAPAIATVTSEATIGTQATSANFTVSFVAVGTTTITFTAEGYTEAVVNITAGNVEVVPTYGRVAVNATTATSIPISTLFGKTETLTCTSSNTELIPNPANVTLANGAGTISVTPVEGAVGSAKITFMSDETAVAGSVMIYVGEAVMGYFADTANHLQAIVYSDATVYMDTSGMDLDQIPDVYFTVTFDADGAAGTGAATTLVTGPLSAQKYMLIDIPGYVLFDGTATTTITMHNYTTRAVIATLNGGAAPVALSEPLVINMDKNSDRDAFKADGEIEFVPTYPTGATDAPEYIAKGDHIDTEIVIPGFTFLGWGATADATAYFDLTIGEGDDAPTIEAYLFATYGNFVEHYPTTESLTGAYAIYAIWDDTVSVQVLYRYAAEPDATLNGNVYLATQTPGTDDPVAIVHDVPSVAQVGDSLLLRIQQSTAGNYTYAVGVYSTYEWDADASEVVAVEIENAARMITNGVWVIDEIPSNIYIVVTATDAADAPITGYHFFIDSVETTTASMSWDAVDYVPAGAISFDGTYYREDTVLGNVYGSFELLQNPTYALIVDNVAQTDADAAVVLSEDLGYNYDYSIEMADGFSIYAAQGIWVIPNADPEEDPTLVYTPWSLVAQA